MVGSTDEYLTPDMVQELEELQAQEAEESQEDQFDMNQELMDAYGSPEQTERKGTGEFLHKAAFGNADTTRTTFLHEHELGKPLFSVRFLLDMEKISRYYLDPLLKELDLEPSQFNGIANYFYEKHQNITSSGMSNKGFLSTLNVSKKVEMSRTRVRNIENLKGGAAK